MSGNRPCLITLLKQRLEWKWKRYKPVFNYLDCAEPVGDDEDEWEEYAPEDSRVLAWRKKGSAEPVDPDDLEY